MNFVIDPDVFSESFYDSRCQVSLLQISTDITLHQFYRDADTVLEKEYRSIFNERYRDYAEHPAIGLLKQILFEDGDPETIISGQCMVHHRDRLAELGCTTPVEPEMIGMLTHARELGLVFVLVGMNTSRTRPRGFHSAEIFRCVGKMFPWLEVAWAGRPRIDIPLAKYRDDDVSNEKSKEFEPKSSLWLQDFDTDLRCITPPTKKEMGGEQIDVYGYREKSEKKVVVVGECKLRREGNEATKPIECSEVQQLRRKLIAARKYEASRRCKNFADGTPCQFEGLLISNATDLDDSAKELIDSENDFRIRFLSVKLPKGWETEEEWRILSGSQRYPKP